MRYLITRPEDDSQSLAEALSAMGHDGVCSPVMRIVYRDGPALKTDGCQAFLATSANGVRAIANRSNVRHLPLIAVGDATARAAKDLGFKQVTSATGDVASLADLVRESLDPGSGPLLHAAGETLAGDLAGLLNSAGFQYRRETLYEAQMITDLAPAARTGLENRTIDGVLIYSPRSARAFLAQVDRAGLAGALAGVTAYCLSTAVADALSGRDFRAVLVAETPNQQALLSLIN